MDVYRSKSCRDGRDMQLENYNYGTDKDLAIVPAGIMNDLPRSYSTTHVSSSSVHPPPPPGSYNNNNNNMMIEIKKVKNTSQGSSSIGKSWSLNDPELKRKKRIAGYKVYAVQGKMKGSFRKSFRWIKDIVYGWR
ncbi:hypothetical protein AgCh_016333 [Apium graveolens]